MAAPASGEAQRRRGASPATALVLIAAIAVAPGCSAIPGIDVEADDPSPTTGKPYAVHPITGELVEEMAQRQSPDANRSTRRIRPNDYQYRVGPGDVLSVVVWNHPELTNPFGEGLESAASGRLVRADGQLYFPFVGAIKAAGRTLEQIQERLERGLQSYIQQPQVNVRVREYRSKQVYVTGEVRQPGRIPITDRPLTVLDALSRAGGFTERVPNRNPDGAKAQRALLTRDGRTRPINLAKLYRTGAGNRLLQDGDVLHVPDDSDSKVFVLGEVEQQTTVPLDEGELTLAEAIAGAEGINLPTANTRRIYVIRGLPSASEDSDDGGDGANGPRIQPQIYRLDASDATALLLADAFPLQRRDVVFVSTAEVVQWGRVLRQITPSLRAIDTIDSLESLSN